MKFRKIFAALCCAAAVITAVCPFDVTVSAQQPGVSAQAAALICVNNSQLLYSVNADERLSMASTTKIMTSLLMLEACTPAREITVTDEMVRIEGTSMGLLAGDTVTFDALVHGMLLQSGNDAANTAAYALGGSPEGFAALMNARAAEIGMKNTCFVTASGLDNKEHYSTAHDMALLACEAIKNPEFRSICSKKYATVSYGNPPYDRTLTNHNRLLWSYDHAIGMKTGFTKKSGRCLVSAAEKDGVILAAVTLNAPDDWNDHIRMLDYGFSVVRTAQAQQACSGRTLAVVGGEQSAVELELACVPVFVLNGEGEKIRSELRLRRFEYAPLESGRVVGSVVYFCGEKAVGEAAIVTAQSVARAAAPIEPQAQPSSEKDNPFTRAVEKARLWLKSIFDKD